MRIYNRTNYDILGLSENREYNPNRNLYNQKHDNIRMIDECF